MRKKTVFIILAVILAIVLGFGVWMYLAFNGSLIRKLVMTKQAEQYVAQVYAGEDLVVDFATYDFKMGGYSCNVHSPSGGDLYFSVYQNSDGNLTDDFALRVLAKENTIFRLTGNLDDFTEEFLAKNFPHRTTLVMCDVDGEITDAMRNKLRINMPFSIDGFPLPCEMGVWTETAGDAPTWEEAAERLKELRRLTKDVFPFVTSYHLGIQNRYVETDGEWEPEDSGAGVYVFDVPAEVIDDDDAFADWMVKERRRQEAEEEALQNG